MMQRISSQMTFFSKTIFPLIWFGFLAVFVVLILSTRNDQGGPPLFALVVPAFMVVIGIFVMKKMVWDLADEVIDEGDSLDVRFGNVRDKVSLSNIINVSYSYMMNPARVTLTLRMPGRFGNEISFLPPQSFVPFAKSPVVASLIERVDAARRAST